MGRTGGSQGWPSLPILHWAPVRQIHGLNNNTGGMKRRIFFTTLSRNNILFRWNSASVTQIFSKGNFFKFHPYCCCVWDNISIISIIWDNILHKTRHCWNHWWWSERCLLRLGKKPANQRYFVISESEDKIAAKISHLSSLTLSFCSSLWWCPSRFHPGCCQESL